MSCKRGFKCNIVFPMMNTYNLELFKVFYYVAKLGSLTKASKLLGYPKSKISKDLSKLENILNHKLLHRGPRGVTMTEKGQIFYKNSKGAIEVLMNTPNCLEVNSNELKGRIKITAPEDVSEVFLLDLANDFQQLHPKVKIEIFSTTDIISFQDTDIDFALRIGKLEDSSLIQKKLRNMEVKYLASREYLKSHSSISKLSDLSDHRIGSIKTIVGERRDFPFFNSNSITFCSNSVSLLKKLAFKSNMIITLPLFYCEQELRDSRLKIVLEKESFFKGPLYLLSREQKFMPEHTKRFKAMIIERISQ